MFAAKRTALFIGATLFSTLAAAGTPYNWTGYYAGLNIGAVRQTTAITDDSAVAFQATIQQSNNPNVTGGFQLGYRRQAEMMSVTGVYGAEFSANFTNSEQEYTYGSSTALYNLTATNNLNKQLLVQIMGGIAADRTLLFLSAGLSWVAMSGTMVNTDEVAFFHAVEIGQNMFGTVVGAGLEYAFCDKVSARFKLDVITPFNFTTMDSGHSFSMTNNIVQGTVGVNYRFA